MELPHGVLVKSFIGPVQLSELNAALLKDAFTGFMRASLLKGPFAEGVVVYSEGKPVIAFTSDEKMDHLDGEQKGVMAMTADEDSAIELFSLNAGQLRLVTDFGKEFTLRQPPQARQPKVEAPKPMPAQRPRLENEPRSFPEVRGRFIKSESPVSLQSYIDSRNDETGHASFIKHDDGQEYHLLLLKGKVVAAYSAQDGGSALLGSILQAGGTVEFYQVDESLVNSIIKMYPHVALAHEKPVEQAFREPAMEPRPMQVQRPEPAVRSEPTTAHGPASRPPADNPRPMDTHRYEAVPRQGMATKPSPEKIDQPNSGSGLDSGMGSSNGMGMPAPEAKSTGTLKSEVDDDTAFVRKVEREFVGNVDELLKRLELSHLKVVPDKKKRP